MNIQDLTKKIIFNKRKNSSDKAELQYFITVSLISAVVGAVFLLITGLLSIEHSIGEKIAAYITAAIFWISVVIQIGVTIKASIHRKHLERQKGKGQAEGLFGIGVISFFKNREAMAADILLFMSAASIVVMVWLGYDQQWVVLLCISLLFLSFSLHCIYNGKNYRYKKYQAS